MIKHSGVVRRMDDLGRIVIPKGMRNLMNVKEGDPYEISCTDNGFVIEKYNAEQEAPEEEVKEEIKKEKILVEIKKDYDKYLAYLKISEEAWELLEWLSDEELLDSDMDFEKIKEIPVIEF